MSQSTGRTAAGRARSVDTRSARALVALAVAGMTAHGLAMTLTGPAVPRIMDEFAIRETAIGSLFALGSLGYMAGCLVGGFVTDEVGLKPMLLAAWAGVAASLVGVALSPGFAVLVLAYFLLGAASGTLETELNVLPAQIGGGAAMMNVIHFGFGIGALAAPMLVGYLLVSGYGWRLPYWLTALVPASLAVAALGVGMPAAPRVAAEDEERLPLGQLLRHRAVLIGAAGLLLYVGAEMGLSNWIVLYMAKVHDLAPIEASAALSVFWALVFVGRLLQGPLAARFSVPALIVVGSTLFGAALVGLAVVSHSGLAYFLVGVAGLGASGLYPNIMIHTNQRYARQVGVVTGALSMAAAVGVFLFQPVIGRVAEVYGLQVSFLGMAGCCAGIVACFLPVWLGRVAD